MWIELQHKINKIIIEHKHPLMTKLVKHHKLTCHYYSIFDEKECDCDFKYEIVIKENNNE